MVLLVDLLEEATERANAFADEAREAIEFVGALVDRAGSLAEGLAAEEEKAHGCFDRLTARLEGAEGELETSGRTVRGQLDDLVGRAATVREGAEGLFSSVDAEVERLKKRKTEMLDLLEHQLASAGTDFASLSAEMDRIQAETEKGCAVALKAVGDFRHEVALARDEFKHQRASLRDSMTEVRAAALEQGRRCLETVEALIVAQTGTLIELGNRLLTEHNQTVVPIRRTLAEDAPGGLPLTLEPLAEGVQALREICDGHAESVRERASPILTKAEEALVVVERIKPALNTAERLP